MQSSNSITRNSNKSLRFYTLVELSSFSSTRVVMAGPGLWLLGVEGVTGEWRLRRLATSGGLNKALVLLQYTGGH